jgi:glycosyltransferase involved in cell wall biosynthesis
VHKTAYRHARVYDVVRSAHLERAHRLAPASILHRGTRNDFDATLTAGLDMHRGGLGRTAWTVARSALTVLEVNEPLMRRSVVRTAVVVAAARSSARLRRRRTAVVSYAIENADPFVLRDGASLRARVRAVVERRAGRYVACRTDALAYGTSAAAQLYEELLGSALGNARTVVVPALPTPCDCADPGPGRQDHVLFLGALHPRKGLPELLEAWPEVRRRRPAARLTVLGQGPLRAAVEELAERVPGVELVPDAPRSEVHAALRSAALVVLLSQRTPTWREQVGLPIVEGLAHGCAVLASTETGLADWLAEHGHDVLAPGVPPAELAGRIVASLERARPVASVLADLPDVDGRLAADAWLLSAVGAG